MSEHPIVVYGASDDLIEVEGCIREEFSVLDGEAILGFSNGILLEVRYTSAGVWAIRPLAGKALTTIEFATDPDENYSDRALLHEPAAWVVCGSEWAKRDTP